MMVEGDFVDSGVGGGVRGAGWAHLWRSICAVWADGGVEGGDGSAIWGVGGVEGVRVRGGSGLGCT